MTINIKTIAANIYCIYFTLSRGFEIRKAADFYIQVKCHKKKA
jgi:hypothetical protein